VYQAQGIAKQRVASHQRAIAKLWHIIWVKRKGTFFRMPLIQTPHRIPFGGRRRRTGGTAGAG